MRPSGCDRVVRAVVSARPRASADPVSADASLGVDVCETCDRGRREADRDVGRRGENWSIEVPKTQQDRRCDRCYVDDEMHPSVVELQLLPSLLN